MSALIQIPRFLKKSFVEMEMETGRSLRGRTMGQTQREHTDYCCQEWFYR